MTTVIPPPDRADRIGMRYWTSSNADQGEPPYVPEEKGSRWFSSGIPMEESSPLEHLIIGIYWVVLLAFMLLCFVAIWAVKLASEGMLDWILAAPMFIVAYVGIAVLLFVGWKRAFI